MSNIPMQGKFGRKPPKNAPALMLASFLTGITPPHPATEDYLSRLTNWQMLGNDQYGDCVAVTWANMRRLVTATLATENYPTLDQVIALYKTQNPNFPTQDDGMDIQTCLEYLNSSGGPDGTKVVAFAKVDFTNLDEVKAALAIFGCLWIGINVQQANVTEFDDGQPWDYVSGSPVEGGHSVIGGGYAATTADDVRFITWAQETGFTDNFWSKQVEEAWAVIWPEQLGTTEFEQGINLTQLAADYQALTGKVLQIPVAPTPAPVPSPSPTPTPAPAPGCVLGAVNQLMGLFKK
ncbi:MAG: hypothetical protein WBW94_00755 [Anaerolineales bacterium]